MPPLVFVAWRGFTSNTRASQKEFWGQALSQRHNRSYLRLTRQANHIHDFICSCIKHSTNYENWRLRNLLRGCFLFIFKPFSRCLIIPAFVKNLSSTLRLSKSGNPKIQFTIGFWKTLAKSCNWKCWCLTDDLQIIFDVAPRGVSVNSVIEKI